MKLADTLPLSERKTTPGFSDFIDNLQSNSDRYAKLEEAYSELELFETALTTGDFAVLVGKKPGSLRHHDIIGIKNKILQILSENPFFQGGDFVHSGGEIQFSLLASVVGHGIETVLTGILTAALAGATAVTALTGLEILAAPLAVGTGVGAYSTNKQLHGLHAMIAAYKLAKIVNAFDVSRTYDAADVNRSEWQRFKDWIEHKTPEQIRAETKRKIDILAKKKEMQFKHAIRGMPKFIVYTDDMGEKRQYPVDDLFQD